MVEEQRAGCESIRPPGLGKEPTMKDKLKNLFTIIALAFLIINPYSGHAQETLKLATTTSTYETGLLDYILIPFEEKNNIKVHIISVGTGKAIKLGENGDVDVILVHARKVENKFIENGFGVNRRDVMYNDYVIIGPKNDPAGVKGIKNPQEAFLKISQKRALFISRGDDSGTHKKEKSIWLRTKVDPTDQQNKWYLESGQGMSATLRIADEKNGYTLIDRGTYLFNKKNIRLDILIDGGEELLNPYGIIAVSPYEQNHVQYENAMALIAWVTSPVCQDMIENFKVMGNVLFHKNANPEIKNKE